MDRAPWLLLLLSLGACGDDDGTPDAPLADAPVGSDAPPAVDAPAVDAAVPEPCDTGLALDDTSATSAAHALGFCSPLASARWVAGTAALADPGTQVGLMAGFGANVVAGEGERLLVLSSGSARTPSQPGYCGTSCSMTGAASPPAGFPLGSLSCPPSLEIDDAVGLELAFVAPPGVSGFQFDHIFYSHDYPDFPCTTFNDQFEVIVSPAPTGSNSGSVTFDATGVPISINSILFDACEGCAESPAILVDTGFATNGATGWLRTTVPVTAGESYLVTFHIWDLGDQTEDSTVVLDGFRWLTGAPPIIETVAR